MEARADRPVLKERQQERERIPPLTGDKSAGVGGGGEGRMRG